MTSRTDVAPAGFSRAFWVREPHRGEIREEALPEPGPGEVRVRTRYSGISRGTEALVFRGEVPKSQWDAMRAPHQAGDLGGAVKYGYLNVGVAETGELAGRTVFCLYPHQTAYVVPADAVTPVPDDVPARRAVLAGTVETALNALWDLRPMIGDRVTVVGAGMVGCCVARLLARIPGVEVSLVDVADRTDVASALGVAAGVPATAQDAVVHCSATSDGLQLALDLLAPEGTVLDLSWYGDRTVELRLGEAFHSRRLRIRSSQVGGVARGDRTHADRLALALRLLRDPAFDVLLTGRSPFDDLPDVMARLANGMPALCHTIDYEDG